MARRAAVNVLLDTCALLALADGDLPPAAASALRHAPEAYVSTVSAWEVAIKASLGRLRLPIDAPAFLRAAIRDLPVAELPITLAHAAA